MVQFLQEAFFTKSVGKHSATGYIEERLRNVRRRMPDSTHLKESSPQQEGKSQSKQSREVGKEVY